MSLENILDRCVERWRGEGIALAPPLAEPEICRVWQHFGKRLSHDVIQLYTTVSGFADYVFDADFVWCLWPWDRLQEQNAECPTEGIQFCDHLIDSARWEVRFEDERHSSVWRLFSDHHLGCFLPQSHVEADEISPSLEDFFRQYLEDCWPLL